jgi:hypothetical protein
LSAIHRTAKPPDSKRRPDDRDAALAAELADEAAARPERAVDPGDDVVGPLHPVERRVAEDGVELVLEAERLPVHDVSVEALGAGGRDLGWAPVHSHDPAAQGHELLREDPVPTAEVEDALPRPGRQQVDDRLA